MLQKHKESHLFISGCCSNQGKLCKYFDHVVLLKAVLSVMLDRINKRTFHNYGKTPEQKVEVIDSFENVLPLLEKDQMSLLTSPIMGLMLFADFLKHYYKLLLLIKGAGEQEKQTWEEDAYKSLSCHNQSQV